MRKRLNEPRMTSGGKWALVAIFVVLLIGTFLGGMNNQNRIADEAKKEVKAADEKKEVAIKEPEIKSTDLKASTPETIEDDLKLYDKDIDKVVVKDKALIVTYKDSAFWSDNSLMEEYAYDSINLIEDLYPNQNFDLFAFERPTLMTDDNGNENMDTVFKSFYTRDTLDQMNLDNFTDMVLVDRERYFQKADGYWLHPGIFLNVDKKLREGIRSPINFDNMDESRYNMRDGTTNDPVDQPDSVKKEEPIVAEPVTEDTLEGTADASEIMSEDDGELIAEFLDGQFQLTTMLKEADEKYYEMSLEYPAEGDDLTTGDYLSLMVNGMSEKIIGIQKSPTADGSIKYTANALSATIIEMQSAVSDLVSSERLLKSDEMSTRQDGYYRGQEAIQKLTELNNGMDTAEFSRLELPTPDIDGV